MQKSWHLLHSFQYALIAQLRKWTYVSNVRKKEITTVIGYQACKLLIAMLYCYFHTRVQNSGQSLGIFWSKHKIAQSKLWPFTQLCRPVYNRSLFSTWLTKFHIDLPLCPSNVKLYTAFTYIHTQYHTNNNIIYIIIISAKTIIFTTHWLLKTIKIIILKCFNIFTRYDWIWKWIL